MLVTLDGEGALNERLYRGLRKSILHGHLQSGARLPSTRDLASALAISRNVVVMAFDQLVAEGYIESRTGSGSFVSDTLPDASLAPWRPRAHLVTSSPDVALSEHARRVLALAPLPAPGKPPRSGLRYDFRYGIPAVGDFPQRIWSRLLARRGRAMSIRTLRYGGTLGYGPLRKAIADYVTRARGVAATPDQIVIVNGAQQALDLIARLFIDRGDRVAMEEPGYQAARQVFIAAGARLLPIPVDEYGMDVARLPRRGSVRLAYVTPSHQFPLGSVLPLARRLELLRWADATGAHIVEDDYDSEFRYEGRPLEAVQGLDRSGRVLYVGTFSKVLFPSLRIGYLVVPESLISAIAALRFLVDYHTPTFEQEVLADFMSEGHFERHLRRSRARNEQRRGALLEAMDSELGDAVQVTGENAGVHLVAWLREVTAARLEAILSLAASRGLGIYPVSPYYIRPPRRGGLLLGYACLTEREIRDGITLLGNVLASASRSQSNFAVTSKGT